MYEIKFTLTTPKNSHNELILWVEPQVLYDLIMVRLSKQLYLLNVNNKSVWYSFRNKTSQTENLYNINGTVLFMTNGNKFGLS
jgi:hypothetical protein